jgi:hypothetical protein
MKTCKSFFLGAKALSANLNLIPFPQHDFPTHKRLLHSLTFCCVREYFQRACALAPFSFTPTSFDITSTVTELHPEFDGYFPFS